MLGTEQIADLSGKILGPIYEKAYFWQMFFELSANNADNDADYLNISRKFEDLKI